MSTGADARWGQGVVQDSGSDRKIRTGGLGEGQHRAAGAKWKVVIRRHDACQSGMHSSSPYFAVAVMFGL